MKLVIGNKNYSSWSLRPWLLLRHFEVPFEEVQVWLFTPGYKEQLHAYNEAGQVPVLVDDTVTVVESLAICEYISEQYLDGAGWPADKIARAQARACSAGMHAGFSEIRNNMPMNVRAEGRHIDMSPEIDSEIQRLGKLWSKLREAYEQNGSWLFGDFSIADCMFAPMAFRFNTYGVKPAGRAGEYCDLLLQDPAMQEWQESAKAEVETIDFAEVGQ